MNMLKGFVKFTWDVFFHKVAEIHGYRSVKALYYAKKCSDHHKAWQLFQVAFESLMMELLTPYVKDGQTITNIKQISNALVDTLSSNSSSTNYSNAFQNHKLQQEQIPLNFESDNIEDYNLPFTLKELQDSLNKPMTHPWGQMIYITKFLNICQIYPFTHY